MQPGTWLGPTALILTSGLLVLAGVFSDARPALAQAQETCPLPAGVTPPTVPRVTAQQVEDGSASLRDFALAVKAQIVQGRTLADAVYSACLLRQEGSPWRSGSTYLVQLTPDGRVFVHAKDMSLSGWLLQPEIYDAILQAVGISPADLADPATITTAFTNAAAGEGGPFHAGGDSGYAVVFFGSFGFPNVLLAGFDLDASHVAEEQLDYGNPTVTARDVVDRATLKAFVTQAGEYFIALMESGDAAAASKARLALRDPNGPWRHGSVYLSILDLTSNIILIHAAFPDRYEMRPLIATVRDVVTGELILPQVIEAAKGNPEGGFVEYYFDDPTDDTDSADIPKVGYARVFTAHIPVPDGRTVLTDFIINSGFYLSSEDVGLVGRLENPGPDSSQSGVSALWGWVCDAALVEIEIETAQGAVGQYLAEYGLERLDTLETCGDADNGFVLLFNWNLLGAGEHRVTALVDGMELGRALVRVTTLGEGDQQEFLEGVMGECVAQDFPYMGQSTRLEWQQNSQNFVITNVE